MWHIKDIKKEILKILRIEYKWRYNVTKPILQNESSTKGVIAISAIKTYIKNLFCKMKTEWGGASATSAYTKT